MNTQDRKLILAKLELLRRYRNELAPLLEISRALFETNLLHVRATERLFQVMVECAIDANRLTIEALDWDPAEYARTSFERLREHQVLDEELASKYIKKHVERRNVIVHLYEKITPRDLYYFAKRLIEDSDEYIRQIQKFLAPPPRKPVPPAR